MRFKDLFFVCKNKKSGQTILTEKKKEFLKANLSLDSFLDSDVDKFLKGRKK